MTGFFNHMKKVCTGFFNTLANKTRLSILYSLQNGEKSVNEIVELTGHEQSLISHNLKLLKQCKFIEMRVNGKQRMYSLNQDTIAPLFNLVEKHMTNFCDCKDAKCVCIK
jgi:DNA-binding transcriptional ArsR family regulator